MAGVDFTVTDSNGVAFDVDLGSEHTAQDVLDTINAAATLLIDGRPHAVTTGDDQMVRIWDLAANRPVAGIALPLPADAIATSGREVVVGMRNEIVVLTQDRRLQVPQYRTRVDAELLGQRLP